MELIARIIIFIARILIICILRFSYLWLGNTWITYDEIVEEKLKLKVISIISFYLVGKCVSKLLKWSQKGIYISHNVEKYSDPSLYIYISKLSTIKLTLASWLGSYSNRNYLYLEGKKHLDLELLVKICVKKWFQKCILYLLYLLHATLFSSILNFLNRTL